MFHKLKKWLIWFGLSTFSERCVPGTCHVRALPSVLWVLRQLRCNSDLPEMDHIFELHQIWFRRNCSGYLWLLPWKAKVLTGILNWNILPLLFYTSLSRVIQQFSLKIIPDLLPFQEPDHHPGGVGHVGQGLPCGHHRSGAHLHCTESVCICVPPLEAACCSLSL